MNRDRAVRAGWGIALVAGILSGCAGPGPSAPPAVETAAGADSAGTEDRPRTVAEAGAVPPGDAPPPSPFPLWSATFRSEGDSTAAPVPPASRLSGAALDSAWAALLREEPRVPPAGETQDWLLDGDNLTSVTTDSGQVMHIRSPRIWHHTLRIRAADAFYQPARERVRLVGDVLFADPEFRGRSDEAVYSRERRILHARGYVLLRTDTLEVRGREAFFYRDRNAFLIRGDVRGKRGSRDMTADEAEWFRDRNAVHLRGNALITEPGGDTRLSGEEVVYDLDADEAYVPDRPRLVLNPEGNTTWITGERLWVEPNGNSRAAGNVEVVRGGVVATADSALFYRDRRVAVLMGAPTVRERDGTLSGDTLFIRFDEEEAIDGVDVHGHAHVRFAPRDSLRRGEVSTVRGDSLTMSFIEGGADRVLVFGDAYSTYEPARGDASEGTGTNAVKGDSITIFLDDGRVDEVHVNGNARGVYAFSRPDSAAADTTESGTGPAAADTTGTGAAPGDGSAPPDSLERGGKFAIEGVRPTKERVIYSADTVIYTLDAKTVDLVGKATLDYGPLTLTAGKVRFYASRRYLEAEDNPVLIETGTGGAREVVGHRMDYNLDTQEGTISEGRTKAEEGYIYADRLRQVGDDDYLAKNGNFTTCDLAADGGSPHFHFTSNRMRIYLKDKVVAKPVTLYIRDIPVLALPFYVFSVRKGRHSGILTPDLDFGLGGTSGRFFRNLGYYWAASEYFDLTFANQYSERDSRFVGEIRGRYAKRYLMSGDMSVRRAFGPSASEWDIEGGHNMALGSWKVTGRAEFRNIEFRREDPLGPDFGSRLDRILKSDLSASRTFPFGANLSLTAARTKDIAAELDDGVDETVLTERLPSYSFSLNSRTLGRLPDQEGEGGRWPALASLRFSLSSSGSSVRTERERTTITAVDSVTADTTAVLIGERTSSARHTLSLSDTRRLLGALNVTPSVSAAEHWVDREFSPADTVKKFGRAAVWSAQMGVNTTLYGTFKGIGAVEAVRHTFRPGASFSYQPEFASLTYTDTSGVRRNRFPGVSASESRRVNLSMENSFQAKVRSGDATKRVDLLRWTVNTGYDFVQAERGERAWQDIGSVIDLSQLSRVGLTVNSLHDPYHGGRIKSFSVTGGYSLSGNLPGETGAAAPAPDAEAYEGEGEAVQGGVTPSPSPRLSGRGSAGAVRGGDTGRNWTAGFTVSYGGTRIDDVLLPEAAVNARATVRLTKNWSVSYDNRWDITEGKILGENLSLRRDLHCWEAQFTRSRLGDETSFYFRINVKQLSDIKYELGRQGGSGLDTISGLLP